jgi:hypothetical protein
MALMVRCITSCVSSTFLPLFPPFDLEFLANLDDRIKNPDQLSILFLLTINVSIQHNLLE